MPLSVESATRPRGLSSSALPSRRAWPWGGLAKQRRQYRGKQMKRPIRLTAVAVVAVTGVLSLVLAASGGTPGTGTQNTVLAQAIAVDIGTAKPVHHMAQVSGGAENAALDFTGTRGARHA